MNNRRGLLVAGAATAIGAFSGCSHNRYTSERYSDYTETVSSVLISADGASIVFIGEWHYIFDAPAGLVKAIKGPYHANVTATLGLVEVNLSNEAQMPYRLVLANATDDQRTQAIADGFKPTSGKGGQELILEGRLRGKIYSANGVKAPAQSVGLNRSYKVAVRREQRALGYQDVPSPIRAVGEGGLAILAIPLVVLALPLIIVAIIGMKS